MNDEIVCCYAIQGNCRFGDTCEYSHDVASAKRGEAHCQFGIKCHLGHYKGDDGLQDAGTTAAVSQSIGQSCFTQPMRCGGDHYLECIGFQFDDTDLLWDELSRALLEAGEDVGDSDLPMAARQRLAEAGSYVQLDENSSDEWLFVGGASLLSRLEATCDTTAARRKEWLVDDLTDARALWQEVDEQLKSQGSPDDGPDSTATSLQGSNTKSSCGVKSLARCREEADVALQNVFRLGRPEALPGLDAALATASEALQDLRALGPRLLDNGRSSGHASWGPPGADACDLATHKLGEISRCLSRCGQVLQLERAEAAAKLLPSDLQVGGSALAIGFTAPAEVSLNGQAGLLESVNSEDLWQLRLEKSGTRLLLPKSQLAPVVEELHGEGRGSLMQLARSAALAGELVLVHHAVYFGDRKSVV